MVVVVAVEFFFLMLQMVSILNLIQDCTNIVVMMWIERKLDNSFLCVEYCWYMCTKNQQDALFYVLLTVHPCIIL